MHLEELSIVIGCCKEAACFTAACKHHEQEGMWGDDTVKRKIVLLAVDYWKVLTTKQGKPELPHKFTSSVARSFSPRGWRTLLWGKPAHPLSLGSTSPLHIRSPTPSPPLVDR